MKTSKEEMAERLRLYDQGLSDIEIARRTGKKVKCISNWRGRHGLKSNSDRRGKRGNNHGKAQLCWTCQNTHADKCPWFEPNNPQPVEGWTATPTVNRNSAGRDRIHESSSYHVIDCPNYKPMEGKTND